ncbi:MAG: hypothetical protein JNM69_21570 [Archangium sp.]|nr:hypothetical protein [Archangium sp.]
MELLQQCLAIGVEVCGFRRGCVSMREDGGDPWLELDGTVSQEQLASLRRRLPGVRVDLRSSPGPGVAFAVPGVTPALARAFVERAHDDSGVTLTVMFSSTAPIPLRLPDGLDAVRRQPEVFLTTVEAKQLLALALAGPAVEVCARRATQVEVTFDGLVSISDDSGRYAFEALEDTEDTLVERLVEHVTYQRTVKGRAHDEAAVVNALSNTFSIEVVRGGDVLQQRWRLGRRVGPVTQGSRRGRFDNTLFFEPDPVLFERPLRREEVREVVEHLAGLLPRATFFFDGVAFHVETLEAAARKVIGSTPLWSEQLFHFSIDEPDFTVRVALGLCDAAQPPLHVLRNARVTNPFGMPARGVRRSLARAVKLSPHTEAPTRHLTGIVAFETVDDVKETDALLTLIEQRFVEAWSVYLDAVPRARERLSAAWAGSEAF